MTRAELGQRAEIAVADYVFACGFSVLSRNLRLGRLELDVVARRGPLVIVVEVRTRGPGSLVGPFESVTRTKRARLARAAERLWRSRLAASRDIQRLRIDVAAVRFEGARTLVDYAPGVITL